jgi:hypothetical protein
MTWEVSGPDIEAVIGTGADTAWAATCAAAVNAAYTTALNGYVPASPSDAEDELTRAALLDGVTAYKDRGSPYGILSVGPDGEEVRVGYDVIRAGFPAIYRYAIPGIG